MMSSRPIQLQLYEDADRLRVEADELVLLGDMPGAMLKLRDDEDLTMAVPHPRSPALRRM